MTLPGVITGRNLVIASTSGGGFASSSVPNIFIISESEPSYRPNGGDLVVGDWWYKPPSTDPYSADPYSAVDSYGNIKFGNLHFWDGTGWIEVPTDIALPPPTDLTPVYDLINEIDKKYENHVNNIYDELENINDSITNLNTSIENINDSITDLNNNVENIYDILANINVDPPDPDPDDEYCTLDGGDADTDFDC